VSDVLTLCYHGVSESWPVATAVTPGQLETQLRLLVRRGYRGATFTDALTSPPAARTVAVTFDDAHRSVIELAVPIMSRLGIPGTVFVPTDYPDGDRPMDWIGMEPWLKGPHEGELACMSWEELRRLAATGWEVGSHCCSHTRLTELDADRLDRELRESRHRVEQELDRECTSIAYPYGESDDALARGAFAAGYRVGAVVSPHYEPPLPLRWPRIPVGHDGPLRFWRRVSPTFRRLVMAPTGRALFAGARGVKAYARRASP
jgi:peptidoglycan/xylan/chitin deacetylase (PgdA/CDA1 family)